MKTYYGLIDIDDIKRIVIDVCNLLGHGANASASALMLGTIAQETLYGTLLDRSVYRHGVGLCQCDPVAFYDVQARAREKHRRLIMDRYGVNINTVEHRDLAFSPLLAVIWCRLHYLMIPEPIGTTPQQHALYWKKYYNTEAGRGTPEEYNQNYARFIGQS